MKPTASGTDNGADASARSAEEPAEVGAVAPTSRNLTLEEERDVLRLLRGLDRRHPVRRVAEQILKRESIRVEAILPLFKTLSKPIGLYWREQEAAAWALGRAPLTLSQRRVAAEALLPILHPEWGLDIRSRFQIALGRLLLISLPLTLWVYTLQGGNSDWYSPFMVLFISLAVCGCALPFVLPISSVIEDNRRERVRARAILALGHLRVPHGLDGIASALDEAFGPNLSLWKSRERRAAEAALPAILTTLTHEHYGRLARETVPNLCLAFPRANDSLILAILAALEKIGDGRAVKPVEKLAQSGRSETVRTAAENLLPLLRERQGQENAQTVLLRAAAAPETPANLLLRPAQSVHEGDPATLLRSSASENAPTS